MYEIAIWGFVFFWQKNLRMSNFLVSLHRLLKW